VRFDFALAWIALTACAANGLCPMATAFAEEPPAMTLGAVRSLSAEQVAAHPRIRVRGIVTVIREAAAAMFVQDESAAIHVSFRQAADRGLWAGSLPADLVEGAEVEVEGELTPGGFSPPLLPIAVRSLGTRPLPTTRGLDPETFFLGGQDCLLVETRGVIQDVVRFGNSRRLSIRAVGGTILAEGPEAVFDLPPEHLVNAVVTVTGAAGALFNTRGEFIMPRIFIGRKEWIHVDESPSADPFAAPWYPLESLARFNQQPAGPRRIRTDGIVIHTEPGVRVHLQSRAGGVTARARDTVALEPGDRVEVAGFLDLEEGVAGLVHATFRKQGRSPAPEPIRIAPEEILAVNESAALASRMADPGDYHGCLVRFAARLENAWPTPTGGALVLATPHASVTASAPHEVFSSLVQLRRGSDLEVTGISQVDWAFSPTAWPSRVPSHVRLLLRSPADVRLLRLPSWWTPRRLSILAGGIAVVLFASVIWSWLLRQELLRHKSLLATEMRSRRDAALEIDATLKERNRLAANLHDTLLQTLAGIGFQLDACEGSRTGDEERLHFDVARRMVDHATNELHRSVWALRTLPLGTEGFPDALRTLAARLGEGRPTSIVVQASGRFRDVPDFVAGNLLLIAQEAINNALRHANPSRVDVTATEDAQAHVVELRISDDGVGFTPGCAAGVAQGHFGLHGMRERAERLGGSLSIEAAPAAGTLVRAIVPIRDYDGAIAAASD
jgi:signal transduction histidine kinase